MVEMKNYKPLKDEEIESFLNQIDFNPPVGFIDFFKIYNGTEISNGNYYIGLWQLPNMISLNESYNVNLYAPDFFIFGSDGGNTAYCFDKETGGIYDMPFVGMAKEDVTYLCDTFDEFLKSLHVS